MWTFELIRPYIRFLIQSMRFFVIIYCDDIGCFLLNLFFMELAQKSLTINVDLYSYILWNDINYVFCTSVRASGYIIFYKSYFPCVLHKVYLVLYVINKKNANIWLVKYLVKVAKTILVVCVSMCKLFEIKKNCKIRR